MRKLSALALAAAVSVVTVGCYKHTYTFGKGGNTEKDATDSSWHSHWFFGMIGDENVRIDKICPTWDATIKNQMTFLNGVIYLLNAGIIYAPTTVRVWCAEEGPPAEREDEEEYDEDEEEYDEDEDEEEYDEEEEYDGGEYMKLRLSPEQMRRIALHPATLRWARTVSPAKAAQLEAAIAAYRTRQKNVASRSTSHRF